MKTIYLDSDYMCHLENAPDRTEIQTELFDSFIDDVIPYYRYIPQGAEWTDAESGRVIHGEFAQATDEETIDRIIDTAYMTDMQTALELLGVMP